MQRKPWMWNCSEDSYCLLYNLVIIKEKNFRSVLGSWNILLNTVYFCTTSRSGGPLHLHQSNVKSHKFAGFSKTFTYCPLLNFLLLGKWILLLLSAFFCSGRIFSKMPGQSFYNAHLNTSLPCLKSFTCCPLLLGSGLSKLLSMG